jgi:hypothetical protein
MVPNLSKMLHLDTFHIQAELNTDLHTQEYRGCLIQPVHLKSVHVSYTTVSAMSQY